MKEKRKKAKEKAKAKGFLPPHPLFTKGKEKDKEKETKKKGTYVLTFLCYFLSILFSFLQSIEPIRRQTMGKAGRPFGTLKYDNLEDLQTGIDNYFAEQDEKGKPYTVSGLALSLNITQQTLCNYAYKDDYFEAINRARQKCLSYAEDRLFDKDGVNGAKFYLTNNAERMGGLRYADRQEVAVDAAPITFKDFPD